MNPKRMRIPQPVVPHITPDEYWRRKAAAGPELEPLTRDCGDCAVVSGFYAGRAEELRGQPPDVQEGALRRWFCHNHPHRACAGARQYVETR